MKRRILSLIMAVIITIALIPVGSFPASAEIYSGKCGENLTWSLNTDNGLMEIKGTGVMTNWSPYDWDSYRSDIKTVIIENGITRIGNEAFKDCRNLTSATIPT